MAKLSVLLFCCFITVSVLAQRTLVPYRLGNKWGLSDVKANIVLKPVYDGIEELDGKYLFKTTLGKKQGAVYNGKEILKPGNGFILGKDGRFIIDMYSTDGQPTVGSTRLNIYNMEGVRVVKDSVMEFTHIPLQLNASEALYTTFGTKNNSEVLVYNDITKKITQSLLGKQPGVLETGYDTAKKEIYIYRYSGKGGNAKYIIRYNSKAKQYVVTPSKEVVKDPELTIDDGLSYHDHAVKNNYMIQSIEFFTRGNTVQQVKRFQRVKDRKFVTDTTVFTLDGEVKLNKFIQRNGYELYQYDTSPANESDKENVDTIFTYRNYVSWRHNGVLGLLSEDTLLPPQFETIHYFKAANDLKPYYLVSRKTNGVIKIGIIRSDGKTVIPIQYDAIQYNDGGGYGKLLILRNNSKYGIALNDGTIIKQPQYDSVGANELYYSLYIIDHGKYGYYDINGVLCEPRLPYKATWVTHFNEVPFLKLTGEHKKLIGYANFNGTVYFKD